MDPVRSRNRVALGFVIAAKVFGLVGLVIGLRYRAAGAALIGLAGLCVASAIGVCVYTLRTRATVEAEDEKDALRRMMREGTLERHLAELEAERRNTGSAQRD